ncbi:alpha/beta hydrolase [Chitinimonas sp.]|uniref:alpha/beta hydrolase n=1 Tax=Chitinimonas sp. TaxID=1934313 RepID=UPI002F937B07
MYLKPSLNSAEKRCLLLHGLISSAAEFSTLKAPLANGGITLQTPSLAGYSHSPRLKPVRWQDWLAQAEAELLIASQDGPVAVGGLCIGALLALELAVRHPDKVNRLVLLSPTLYYDGWGLSRWRRLRHIGYLPGLRRWIGAHEREPYGVKNPQIRKWIARELEKQACSAAGAAKLPLWAIHEAEKLIAHTKRQLSKVKAPALILHAREDEVTSLKSAHHLVDALPSSRLVVLENSYHMVTLDNDRHLVQREIAAFLHHAVPSRAAVAPQPTPVHLEGAEPCLQP